MGPLWFPDRNIGARAHDDTPILAFGSVPGMHLFSGGPAGGKRCGPPVERRRWVCLTPMLRQAHGSTSSCFDKLSMRVKQSGLILSLSKDEATEPTHYRSFCSL